MKGILVLALVAATLINAKDAKPKKSLGVPKVTRSSSAPLLGEWQRSEKSPLHESTPSRVGSGSGLTDSEITTQRGHSGPPSPQIAEHRLAVSFGAEADRAMFPNNCIRNDKQLPCVIMWMPQPDVPERKHGHVSVCLALEEDGPCADNSYFSWQPDDPHHTVLDGTGLALATNLMHDVQMLRKTWDVAFPLFQLPPSALKSARDKIMEEVTAHGKLTGEEKETAVPLFIHGPSNGPSRSMQLVSDAFQLVAQKSKSSDTVRLVAACAKGAADVIKGAHLEVQMMALYDWLVRYIGTIDDRTSARRVPKAKITSKLLAEEQRICRRQTQHTDKDSPIVPYGANNLCGVNCPGIPVRVVVNGPRDNPFLPGNAFLDKREIRRLKIGVGQSRIDGSFVGIFYIGFHKLPNVPDDEVPGLPPSHLRGEWIQSKEVRCKRISSSKGRKRWSCLLPFSNPELEASTDTLRPDEQYVADLDAEVVLLEDEFEQLVSCVSFTKRMVARLRELASSTPSG